MNSPWGAVQTSWQFAEGVVLVSTAGHGGFLLSPERQRQMPEYLRERGGAYEEDCEWAKVAVGLAQEIAPYLDSTPFYRDRGGAAGYTQRALECLRAWHPDAYERFTGTVLQPGESYMRDQARSRALKGGAQ